MQGSRNIHRLIIRRFSQRFTEMRALEASAADATAVRDQRRPVRLRRFFKMAEHRKRQMLEKMLMD